MSSTSTALKLSSRRSSFRVPGIGTIQGLRANSLARAICAGVARVLAPMSRTRSMMGRLAFRASRAHRGSEDRMSDVSPASLLNFKATGKCGQIAFPILPILCLILFASRILCSSRPLPR